MVRPARHVFAATSVHSRRADHQVASLRHISFKEKVTGSNPVRATCRADATAKTAQELLHGFYVDVERSRLSEFRGLVDGAFRNWEDELLAYFEARITNAYAEGITNKIKVIKRSGYGFRSFARFRERVLVQCGAA